MGVSSNTNDNSQGLQAALMTAGTENGLRAGTVARQMGILTGADAGLREGNQNRWGFVMGYGLLDIGAQTRQQGMAGLRDAPIVKMKLKWGTSN